MQKCNEYEKNIQNACHNFKWYQLIRLKERDKYYLLFKNKFARKISEDISSQQVVSKGKDYSCLETHNMKLQKARDKLQICKNIMKNTQQN